MRNCNTHTDLKRYMRKQRIKSKRKPSIPNCNHDCLKCDYLQKCPKAKKLNSSSW